MAIADKIKYFRKKKGLTQKDLAEKSGLSIATIQGYEQNKYNPKLVTLMKIADALEVDFTQLEDNFRIFVDVKEEIDRSDLRFLKDYCDSKLCTIPSNERNELKESIQFSIHEQYNFSEDQLSNLVAEYARKIIGGILEEQESGVLTDIVELLSYFFYLNQKGKDKIINYAMDLYNTEKYNKD